MDALFRSDHIALAPQDAAVRAQAGRILARGLTERQLSPNDRLYLGQLVAADAGLAAPDAAQRVEAVFTQAQEAADAGRKALSHLLLWVFVGLLAGAFFASLAATLGGKQRDKVVVHAAL